MLADAHISGLGCLWYKEINSASFSLSLSPVPRLTKGLFTGSQDICRGITFRIHEEIPEAK